MQYIKPEGDFFAGDAMPFFHDGVFHLYYLLDEGHHKALDGLGGHQWAHASTTDLIDWQQHPLALAIDQEFEKSICTGSVFFDQGIYYAFYATRLANWHQHLSLATSSDGIHFQKQPPNPLASPPVGYSPLHFRDPKPFQDPQTGLFHLLVSAMIEDPALTGRGGCLAHLTSPDLCQWTQHEPFIVPGFRDVPECPDLFYWNGWYYLIFSNFLTARYRMSRHPLGPWTKPPVDTLDSSLARVMKTAEFIDNRRIGVAWLGTRDGDRDDGKPQWGGNLLLRELIQHADGTLGSKFPTELKPPVADRLATPWVALTSDTQQQSTSVHLAATHTLEVVALRSLPQNLHIRFDVHADPNAAVFGIRMRGSGNFEQGYELMIQPQERIVKLHEETIYAVAGLDQPFVLELILKDDILDVCIDNRRCIINRCPEQCGDSLFLFARNAEVTFSGIEIRPLK